MLGDFCPFYIKVEDVVSLGTHAEGMDHLLLMGCLLESQKELYPCCTLFEATWKKLMLC